MSWTTLSADHVKARLAKDEVESYIDAGGQFEDGSDILGAILSQVTAMVRGKVTSNRDNLSKLGPSGTIPQECLFAAATIARDALVGSLPISEGSTETRREELRQAYLLLEAVAKGEIRIEAHDGSFPEASSEAQASFGGSPILRF